MIETSPASKVCNTEASMKEEDAKVECWRMNLDVWITEISPLPLVVDVKDERSTSSMIEAEI